MVEGIWPSIHLQMSVTKNDCPQEAGLGTGWTEHQVLVEKGLSLSALSLEHWGIG